MSAINKMLRDLDRRNVAPTEKIALDHALRAPSAPGGRRQRMLVMAAAVTLVLGGGYSGWRWMTAPAASLPPEVAAQARPPIPPSLAATPSSIPTPTQIPSATIPPAAEPVAQPATASVANTVVAAPLHVAATSSERIVDGHVSVEAPVRTEIIALAAPPARAAPLDRPPTAVVSNPIVRSKPDADRPIVATPPARRAPAAEEPDTIQKQFTTVGRRGADAELTKAITVLQQGRVEEALEGLRRVLAIEPAHEIARQTLTALLVEQRRLDAAQKLLAEGLEINPGQGQFALLLGRLTLESATPEAATAILQKHAAAGRDNAQYRGLLAAVLQKSGRHADAIPEFTAALALAPNVGAWWVGLAVSQQAIGEVGEAGASYRRALAAGTLSPELAAFVDQRLRPAR